MEEKLIAPCGMNYGVCINYLAMKNDLHKQRIHRKYCSGCIPRGKNCTYMKGSCNLWRRDWSGSVSNVSSSLANDLQPSYVPADPVFYLVLHHIEWYVQNGTYLMISLLTLFLSA